jgi:hypothetical protein
MLDIITGRIILFGYFTTILKLEKLNSVDWDEKIIMTWK